MAKQFILSVLVLFNVGCRSFAADLYPSYVISHDAIKALEWSDDRALAYVLTIRLFDYEHHIFQYRRYPCQYFYTDQIQINYNNETVHDCSYNTSSSEYEYNFQLHLTSQHVDPYILRNVALHCQYINCSLTLLNMKYIRLGWNLRGRNANPECSFDTAHPYAIHDASHKLTEWISLRCKSLPACNRSKQALEASLTANINIAYGSSYELETPYCSLEKNLASVMEKNFAETNRLLEKLVELLERGFGKPNEREQARLREHVEQQALHESGDPISTTTPIAGEVQGIFRVGK